MMKRILAIILASILVFGMFACSSKPADPAASTGATGTSADPNKPKEPVTLEWWYRGNGIQRDTEKVNAHVNELLHAIKGFEHISVHLNPFVISDYATNVELAQTSKQQIDIMSTVGLSLEQQVEYGTFIPLKDMLESEQFAALKKEFPQWLWDQVTFDGSPYIVPSYQGGSTTHFIVIPKQYADLIDLDGFRSYLSGTWSLKGILEWNRKFIDAVRKDTGIATKYCKPMLAMEWIETAAPKYYEFVPGIPGGQNYGFAVFTGSDKVENIYFTEEFKEAAEFSAELNIQGYFPEDIATVNQNSMINKNALKDKAMPMFYTNACGTEEEVSEQMSKTYGYDCICLPVHEKYLMRSVWGAGGNGITASCEHPEDAMAFLQLLNTKAGVEIYNTIVYGLEGTHYEKIDDTHIKTLEYNGSQSNDNNYSAHKWIMGNTFNAWLNQGCAEKTNEIALRINNDPDNVISPCMGFRADGSAVQSQLDQISAVVKQYNGTFAGGLPGKDFQKHYDEFIEKMEASGCQDVIDELQSQFDDFKGK